MDHSIPSPHLTLSALRDRLQNAAQAPETAPFGMPGAFYTDPDQFAHERSGVLFDSWHCVGRVDEIPNAGDFRALTILDESLIIVRDESTIRALSNLCRHRGMPLMQGQGNAKRFVCRYHAWAYDTGGALLRAPRMKNTGFDPKTCKLGEFPCIERFGFIYVCLAQIPPDIDAQLAGLSELIAPYEPASFVIRHAATEIWHCNWKSLVENFMEGYHLSVVHPQTLHGYTPTGLSRKGPRGPGFTSYLANYPDGIESRGLGARGLSPEERQRSTLFSVFPCQVVSIAATLLVSLSILPLGPESIEVRWTMSSQGDDLDDATIATRIKLWEDVNREDREKLEDMQPAMHSRFALGGPLAQADYEGTIRDFIHWLAAQDRSR